MEQTQQTVDPRFNEEELLKAFPGDKLDQAMLVARRLLAAHDARASIVNYARFMRPDPNHAFDPDYSKYVVKEHHQLLGEVLMKVFNGEMMNVALSMPPQHGKSDMCSRFGLSYHTGKFPWKHIIFGTYNQTFAEEFGDDVRALLMQDEFQMVFPGVGLRSGSKSKEHMVTTDGGKLSFIGHGGTGAGRPADGVIIDDPIKDAKEAESLTIRNDRWQWFTRVMNARCHALTWKIIITTRWHEDDLIGRLTDPTNSYYDPKVAAQWTVINIPAIMDNEDIAAALGKKVGDALWPERFPLPLLENARRMDPVGFSALYMGKPTPPEGAFYKQSMIKGYDNPGQLPKNVRYYLTGDLAVSPERNADKSCIGIWALDTEDVLWLLPDLYWERKSSDESVDQLVQFARDYMLFEGFMEKGQLDKAIGPFLEKRLQEEKVTLPITRLPVAGSKGLRSVAIRGRMAQGKVRFPIFAPWWSAAKDQLLKFTGSGNDKEDDFCDMIALIGQALEDQIPASVPAVVPSNVIRVGSFAWVKQESEARRAADKRVKQMARF